MHLQKVGYSQDQNGQRERKNIQMFNSPCLYIVLLLLLFSLKGCHFTNKSSFNKKTFHFMSLMSLLSNYRFFPSTSSLQNNIHSSFIHLFIFSSQRYSECRAYPRNTWHKVEEFTLGHSFTPRGN